MSIFSRKKVSNDEPMTAYSPQPQYQEVERESMIDNIKSAVDGMPNLIYGGQEPKVAQPIKQPAVQVQPQPQIQPQVLQNPQSISQDSIIDAINEINERLEFVEKVLRRVV